MENYIEIYTDGACRGNPGVGGWGVVIIDGAERIEFSGFEKETTNNRMEMVAAIKALEYLDTDHNVLIITDSKYLMQGIQEWLPDWKKRGWKTASKKPVKNKDLWQQLDKLANKHKLEWRWVKGHTGNLGNERADMLANQAIDTLGS